MKPHKFKKFKEQVQFRKGHGGLNMLQMYIAAYSIAQQIAADPEKLQKFAAAWGDILHGDKSNEY